MVFMVFSIVTVYASGFSRGCQDVSMWLTDSTDIHRRADRLKRVLLQGGNVFQGFSGEFKGVRNFQGVSRSQRMVDTESD